MRKVNPGVNPRLVYSHFTLEERTIVNNLGHEWYVTHGGDAVTLGKTSTYRYFLIRPTTIFSEMFNLQQELVCVFSPYDDFETRSLDAIDYAIKQYQPLRVDRICSVLISKDEAIESKLQSIIKSDPESQIVVPFTYNELLNLFKQDQYFIRNRFKSHFYTRDLFAFEAPLKKDIYFFGRNDLIHRLVNRYRANECSGLFGLRKTGKTSVVFGVVRALSLIGAKSVIIDCQNPAFHQRHWNHALWYLVKEIIEQNKLNIQIVDEKEYTETNAPLIFEQELQKINTKIGKKNILIIFDEIENITFRISPSEFWANKLDFVYFWQTLRSIFQKLDNVFSYMVIGTNPLCVETPTVWGKDNPIFNQLPYEYIPGFDVPQTREMVRKIGRIMGLKFDEIIYGKLTDDFGGHPYLIRHVCSVINRITPPTRPTQIDKNIYEQAKNIFIRDYTSYIEMILEVLSRFYNEEHEMLVYLANGDMKIFNDLSDLWPAFTNHLIGYGIIQKVNNSFSFKVECVKEYLAQKQKYQRINLTQNQMLQEISERRNSLEPKIRNIVRMQLLAFHGKNGAKQKMLDIFDSKRKEKYGGAAYEDLFDPNKVDIYFDDLRKIIYKNWLCFENIFDKDMQDFNDRMKAINKYRIDAHAKPITNEKMAHFRVSMCEIEKQVEEFLV